jgi:hypothetical protein
LSTADSASKLHPPCCRQAVTVCSHQQLAFSKNMNNTRRVCALEYNTCVKCQSKRNVNINFESFPVTPVPNMRKCLKHQIPI